MASIMQGTTPSLFIKISPDDFIVTDVVSAELYIRNAGTTKTFKLNELTVDAENNRFIKKFTEFETAAFVSGKPVTVQGRFWFSNGNVIGINKVYFDVDDMMEVGADG